MDLNEIYVNKSQLALLVGKEIGIDDVLDNLEISYTSKNPKCTLQQVKKSGLLKKTECFDSRYDKKDPIDMVITQISEKGIGRELLEKILSNTACIKKVKLVGVYEPFAKILSEDQLAIITRRLKEAQHHYITSGKIKKSECLIYKD